MTTKKMSASGVVTYWTTAEMNLDALRSACMAVDANLEKYLPNASTPMSALRQALEQVFPKMLIRTLDRDGFAVVKEDRGQQENEYNHLAAAWFDGDDLHFASCDSDTRSAIRGAYKGHRGILQPAQAGAFLSRIVGEYLGGVMLRPKTGGVYWVPADRSAAWAAIGDAFESASVIDGSSAVYVIRHEMDEAAVRAVRDALIHEVTGEAERINTEIMSGELKAKALQAREREAVAMIKKVTRYESILDTALTGVRKALGDVKDAAAAAALLAQAEADLATVGAGE